MEKNTLRLIISSYTTLDISVCIESVNVHERIHKITTESECLFT